MNAPPHFAAGFLSFSCVRDYVCCIVLIYFQRKLEQQLNAWAAKSSLQRTPARG